MSLSIASMGVSVGELQRDYLFQVVVSELPANFTYDSPVVNEIDCFLTKGIFPSRKTEEIAVKWGGETAYFSGVDGSPKTGDLVFRLDEAMRIKDFWEALKDLTGNDDGAATWKAYQTLKLKVYLISVDKQHIREARLLEKVIVYSVEDLNLDKEGSGIQTFKVHISWDRSSRLTNEKNADVGTPNLAAPSETTEHKVGDYTVTTTVASTPPPPPSS
jgi:hypothetical protein